MAYPYCQELRKFAFKKGKELGLKIHSKGTVVVVEGPRFSTLSESLYYSKIIGADLINMTQFPEVSLAAEKGICYLNISLVTDYDAGVYSQEKINPVSISEVLLNFQKNTNKLKNFISSIIKDMPYNDSGCYCKKRAKEAII